MALADVLLSWYHQSRRELPWRKDKDPYKIWVSEIMLQQTRVEAVKEYYSRWLERFPTPAELASASEEEVLCYWQGLGYYARARNLHSAIREICAAYGGKVPDDEMAVRALPGVGEYTAGAILSIAYNQKLPAVDGNVLRIFSRLFCITEDIAKTTTKQIITSLVRRHMSAEQPGDFNQALMDLGAMICVPQRPRCTECPVIGFCQAYSEEIQETLPVKAPKKAPLPVTLLAGIVRRENMFLVRQRPAGGVLAGMWEFPALEIGEAGQDAVLLARFFQEELGQSVEVLESVFHYVHSFSHRKWDITFLECRWVGGGELPKGARWAALDNWSQLPWAGPHRTVAKVIFPSR